MADGGMQRGLNGRAESPYNPNYLPAAYASGSSNGSAVATAARFCTFGMGEETVSSGRSPASNNGLCAYTPSRGLISIRGNWPLFPTRDVVVPHTRTMADMLTLLNVIVAEDPETSGDFWRNQTAVPLPPVQTVRPDRYETLNTRTRLDGVRLGVPRAYTGEDPNYPITLHPGVQQCWQTTRAHLTALGAELIDVDLPLLHLCEGDTPAGEALERNGLLPHGWLEHEYNQLIAHGWHTFLRDNNDPTCNSLHTVDPDRIFPTPPGSLPDRYEEVEDYENRYRAVVALATEAIATHGTTRADGHPQFAEALTALERIRQEHFETWLTTQQLDAIVFPANADVARHDSDHSPASADHAWQNGVLFSNGNYLLRHLGIPTVTLPMGLIEPIGMPVGFTLAGAAYQDSALLEIAATIDRTAPPRQAPPLTPELPSDRITTPAPAGSEGAANRTTASPQLIVDAQLTSPFPLTDQPAQVALVHVTARAVAGAGGEAGAEVPCNSDVLHIFVNGVPAAVNPVGNGEWRATALLPADPEPAQVQRNPRASRALVVATLTQGGRITAGGFCEVR